MTSSKRNVRFYAILILIICLMVALTGCFGDKLDYSDTKNWAFYPEELNNDVDVFFIAPVAGSDSSCNMRMDDEKFKSAFIGATAMEKGIYDVCADFYAPFYRQGTLECYDLDLPEAEKEKHLEIAYKDIDNAFNYYMDNLNNGRPYILASFSQGGDMVKRLLEYNKNINDKMIAAYVIGWNFTEDDLIKYPNIKMAQREDDTGVVVSFCSEAPEYNGYNLAAPNGTIGINPINWRTDSEKAVSEDNLGACFTDYSGSIVKEMPGLCGAYLDPERGTLKVTGISSADYPAKLSFLEDGNYHIYDYQFFYRNLQKNVETRIKAYYQ